MNYTPQKGLVAQPMPIETERLLLKPISEEFREYVFIGLSDYEVRHAMQIATLNTKEKQDVWWNKFKKWRENGRAVQWCVFDKKTETYIGLMTIKEIDFSACRGEVGYSILKAQWRKGYAKEAVSAMVHYGFADVNLHTLVAMISPRNTGSQKVVLGLGFEKEAHFRDIHLYQGKFYDLEQYSKINPAHL